jgi:hypothetical protein
MKSNGSNGAGTHASDPLRTLWDRLDAGGYEPHGEPCAFRARCPAHEGENREALSCSIGADGRALAHCHAHDCDVQDVTAALGLDVCDLFPAGHRRARRLPVHHAQRNDFTGHAREAVDLLYALVAVGDDWRVEITAPCSACGHEQALYVTSDRYETFLSCPNACTPRMAAQALTGRITEAKR